MQDVLGEIEQISKDGDVGKSEYLAGLIFEHEDRVVTAAAIQALHKMSLDNPGAPVILPRYLIDPNGRDAFRMFVLDVFGIKGRGTLATGIVTSGTLGLGHELVLEKSDGRDIATRCADIHLPDSDRIEPGTELGIFLDGLSMAEVYQGDTIRAA